MNAGAVFGIICAGVGAAPLGFGLLTGAMPPLPRRFFDGPTYRDEDPFGYWLSGAFYAGIVVFGCYQAVKAW